MRRFVFAVLAALVLLLAGGVANYRPDLAIRVATGLIAHTLCSSVFVSGLSPDVVYHDALQPTPGIAFLNPAIDYSVDRLRKLASARFLGQFESVAVYRGETGCVIAHEGEYIAPIMDPTKNEPIAPLLPDIAGDTTVETSNSKLKAALDRAFAEPNRPPFRRTKAVVIIHRGTIVAERYAPDVRVDTKLPGYSLSKSVVNALVAILVRQGKLTVDGPAPVPEWKDVSDPRHIISVENLMRMTSGLDLAETNSGFDPSSRILMLEQDMAGAAARAELKMLPGMNWVYSSPSTLIVSRIVKTIAGGQPENVLQLARRELFGPLGIHSMTMEFDGERTPVGSSYFFATARDWARFGLLYLNAGVLGGRQILPEGWVAWSATPTVESKAGYGAGFWSNRGNSPGAQQRVAMGMPPDSFFAAGSLGQYVVIVPSAQLVVVRLGMSQDRPGFDITGTARLVSDTLAALERAP